jgi:hypothetical protein
MALVVVAQANIPMNQSAHQPTFLILLCSAVGLIVAACAAPAGRGGADPETRFAPDSLPGTCPGATITLAAARDTQPRPGALIVVPSEAFPRIPRSYLRRMPRDRVVASFLVDTAGQVVPGSVALLAGRDRRYGSSVCEWLPRMRFSSWRADSASAVRIAMPFVFGPLEFGPRER